MKKIIADTFIVACAFLFVNITIRLFWMDYVPKHCEVIDNPNIHTVVVGASTTEVSLNDTILSSYLNLSQSALWYTANYGTLEWINEYNNISLDTLICASSLTYFLYYIPDYHLDSERLFRSEKYSLLHYWDFIKTYNLLYLKVFFQHPLNIEDFKIKRMGGGYHSNNEYRLSNPKSDDGIQMHRDNFGKYGFTEEVLRKEASEQVYFIKKIKEYCDKHNIVFVIFQAPLYHTTDYVDDGGYRNFILHEFGEDQLVADYQDFEFPDDTYYRDMEHVNMKGSIYLSEHIKKNGLHLITAKENCLRKGPGKMQEQMSSPVH